MRPQRLLRPVALLLLAAIRTSPQTSAPNILQLKSPDFSPGATIPRQFTCDGPDISPAFSWNDPPPSTQSFALVADDPDAPAGNWAHWVLYNLPPTLRSLPQNFPKSEQSNGDWHQGNNDFEKTGYNGPCPPPGKSHRYFFKLYALDTKLTLKPRASKKDVEAAMQSHILAQGQYMGRFSR